MKIELRPINTDRGLAVDLAEVFFVLVSVAVALYFFIYQKNFVLGSSVFGVCTVLMLLYKVTWPALPPVVIITDEGILDLRLGVGVIRWNDIVDVQIEVHGPFVCLRLRDPEVYISRLPAHHKTRMLFHQHLGFRMLNLEMRGFGVNLLDLRDLIRRQILLNKNEQ